MANTSRLIKPTWQLHDLNNNIEHELFEDYIVEFTDIGGIEARYYIRNESDRTEIDDIYGEPKYQNDYFINYRGLPYRTTKVLYDTTEEPTLTDVFGISSDDQIQYAFVPKFTFSRDVSAGYHPKPGDVITTIWNDHNYEVVDVGEEAHIFQLNKMVWEFILRPYRFSEQDEDHTELLAPIFRDPGPSATPELESMGNNEIIESESDAIDNYGDVDTSIYGY